MSHARPNSVLTTVFTIPVMTLALFLSASGTADADIVHLKRGGSLEGEVVEGENTVEVRLEGGSTTFSRDEIGRIEKTDAEGTRGKSPVLKTLSDWTAKTSAWANHMRLQGIKHWNGVKKSTSGWFQPVGKSAAQTKRALKKDGFNIS